LKTVKNEVEVEVFGQKHTVIGDGEPSYIKELAQYVDQAMVRLAGNMRRETAARLATLVAINCADELFRLRKERNDDLHMVTVWATNTIELIEQEMEVASQ
tara:strand:+ start:386 stop:688 length:303 start_codon:yes stop_codon:yes gene_type:complete